ncbi:MAG: chromosomal replication initiator protein DnaA [Candidatus Cloacimonetes bacterium]|nr:chromosomal replication initiator protein DnaA [Candidatus Cloacimonadota bacterium]
MNNLLRYLDYNKVLAEMQKSLQNQLEPSDFLWLQGIKIFSINDDGVEMAAPSDLMISILRERKLDDKISRFFQDMFFSGDKFRLSWSVHEVAANESSQIPATVKVVEDSPAENITSNLNPAFTFDSFVMGGSNRYAYEIAKAVAANPGVSYNPLFIYGEVGLGKTHLLHAIGNQIKKDFPNKVVRYISCETLLNEFVETIHSKNYAKFRRIREVDALLVDDIQFLSNKESFQEEFYHSFNRLFEQEKQIVLASDRTPNQIKNLNDRLMSRFKGGSVADIQLPDLETRMAIIKNLVLQHGIPMSNDAIEYLAISVSSNVRDIRGAFITVATQVSFRNREADRTLIQEALCSFLDNRPRLSMETIQSEVSKFYGIELEDLLSESRNQSVAYPRQVAMFLIRELTNLTLQQIGSGFGRKDHGTVIHAMNKIQKILHTDDWEAQRIKDLKKRLETDFER